MPRSRLASYTARIAAECADAGSLAASAGIVIGPGGSRR